jgi:hypothetical protein
VIEAQFLGNSESRVLQLDARFRAFKQGDLSVRDYCHRMKGMADDLRALGETVTDRHLVLNLLHDPNKRFNHMKIFIKRSQPFPSFPLSNSQQPCKGSQTKTRKGNLWLVAQGFQFHEPKFNIPF